MAEPVSTPDPSDSVSGWRALRTIAVTAFRADPRRATTAILLSTLSATMGAFAAWWTRLLVNGVVEGDIRQVALAALADVVTMAVGIGASLVGLDLRFRVQEATGLLVESRMVELLGRVHGLELHERPDLLDQLELVRSQKQALGGAAESAIVAAEVTFGVLSTAVLLSYLDPLLLLLPLFGLPTLLVSSRSQRALQRAEQDTAEARRVSSYLFNLATKPEAGKELRVFGLRDEVRRRHDRTWDEVDRKLTRTEITWSLLGALAWMLFAVGFAGAISRVALQALRGEATVGDVVLAVTLATTVNGQVANAFGTVAWMTQALKSARRFLWLAEEAEARTAGLADPKPVPSRIDHGIDFVGVGFRYPGTDADVLTGVDLHLPAGSTVAVIGENGAGKSTLVKLLARFYEPTVGAIHVDGVPLCDVDVDVWRRHLSAGFQDFARLELLAREAVGVGDLDHIDDEDVIRGALTRAAAGDVVDNLGQGFDTQLGKTFPGGVDLSGGQWQKLALGRAMMRPRPLLLLLDEPTAALDAETEHLLFEQYAVAARDVAKATGAITVFVSHRFSTVRMADLIVVVVDGRVAEVGSHAELHALGGTYAELYELQARAYR